MDEAIMGALYLGVDVGTSSVKLTCIDESGKVVATASEAYECSEPHPGWREIEPGIWWDAVCSACALLGEKVDLSLIKGVGATGQMHATVLVDAAGVPTCPAIMWNDQRTIDTVFDEKQWALAVGFPQVASFLSTGVPAMNLAWMAKNNPAALSKSEVFLSVSDWIALKFGGHPGMDYCGASTTGLFDNKKQTWIDEVCEHFGVPESLLPAVEPSDKVIGVVSERASAETGIPADASIVRGTGDNPAAAICTGCLLEGIPTISLGTSGVLMYSAEGVELPDVGKPVLFKWGNTLKTQVQLSIRSCGGAKEWWYGQILDSDSYDLEDKAVEDPFYEMRDLMFYPHLSGEKVLHGCPSVRGAFLGLDLDTTRSELERALMEGTAYALRELKESVNHSQEWFGIRLVGGGAKNDFWAQTLSNVLGIDLVRMESSGAGQGAALLALSASCGQDLADIAAGVCKRLDSVEKNDKVHEIYNVRFDRYMRIFKALENIYELKSA